MLYILFYFLYLLIKMCICYNLVLALCIAFTVFLLFVISLGFSEGIIISICVTGSLCNYALPISTSD